MRSIARKLLPTLFAVTAAIAVLAPRPARAIIVARTAVAYRPHPVARTAAVVGTAAVTAAVVGSVVRTLPPSCTTIVSAGVTYQQCGSTWYQPHYSGSQVTYVVV